MFNTVFIILEIVGTIAFAISGAMTAINRRLDALGVIETALPHSFLYIH